MRTLLFCRAPLLTAVLSTLVASAACDENPHSPPVGALEITTSSRPATVTTSDGWAVTFSRFLVHVSSVNVAGSDQVLAASASAQIVDQVAPGSKSLLAAGVRTARVWEDVSLAIAPVTPEAESTVLEPVTEADRNMMQTAGFSIYVEATATKEGVTKSMKLGFKASTLFKDCGGDLNGAYVRGLVVPEDGQDTADVVMDPSVLLLDDLVAPAAVSRFEAIAAADVNSDGAIDMAELRSAPLEAARADGAAYGVGEMAHVTDLGAFLEEQTRRTVAAFRAQGTCVFERQE